MATINLPTGNGGITVYRTSVPRGFAKRADAPFNRLAFAAAHVVADPCADIDPWLQSKLDWEATIAYRRHLWDLGFGVAEAMDTAQRGMGVDWPTSLELIRRSVAAAKDIPGALLFSGAGTDQIDPGHGDIDDVIRAYEEQISQIEEIGGRIVLMASRALAASAKEPDDYIRVYDRLLRQVKEKVIIHWLGDMFDPALRGYWGHTDLNAATDVVMNIVLHNAARIDGVKISLLDKNREIEVRRRLPPGVRMYTGDDFNYAELIAGDAFGYSDALLGIFDAIAPAASAALTALARGSVNEFHDILAPTVPLSRHIFKKPTLYYKTGVVFMAYLNGHQRHFVLAGGQQSARSILHLSKLFRLADQAGLLIDPDLAASRMTAVLKIYGIDV